MSEPERAAAAASVLTVHLPGPPVAQGRPRFTTRNGRPRAIDPAKSRAWKKVAAQLIAIEMRERGFARLEGPVQLTVVAVFPRPQRGTTKRGPNPREWKMTRPDIENVCKAVMDAGQTAGLYADDAQVVRLIGEKWVAAAGEAPGVVVEVRPLAAARGEGG